MGSGLQRQKFQAAACLSWVGIGMGGEMKGEKGREGDSIWPDEATRQACMQRPIGSMTVVKRLLRRRFGACPAQASTSDHRLSPACPRRRLTKSLPANNLAYAKSTSYCCSPRLSACLVWPLASSAVVAGPRQPCSRQGEACSSRKVFAGHIRRVPYPLQSGGRREMSGDILRCSFGTTVIHDPSCPV